MDNYILNCYMKWLKDRNGSIKKQLSRLTVTAIVLIILLCLIMIVGIVFCCLQSELIIIPAIAEVIVGIISYVYTDRFEIKYSSSKFKTYKEHCSSLKKMLATEGIINDDFISEIINRFTKKIDSIEAKAEKNYENLNRFMQVLVIPLAAAVLGTGLKLGTDMQVTILYGAIIIVAILISYAAAFTAVTMYNVIIKSRQNKYRQLVEDLQSILDLEVCDHSDKAKDLLSYY